MKLEGRHGEGSQGGSEVGVDISTYVAYMYDDIFKEKNDMKKLSVIKTSLI